VPKKPPNGPVSRIRAVQPGTGGIRNSSRHLEDNDLPDSASTIPDLGLNKPVVLIRGSVPVRLTAETSPPGQKVNWTVVPNENAESKPELTTTGDTTEPLRNVVFVFVKVEAETTLAFDNPNGAHFEDDGSGTGDIKIRSGKFDPNDPGQYAFSVIVDVSLIGGGRAKDIGIKDVVIHFLQNGLGTDIVGHYDDNVNVREVLKDNLTFPVVDSNGKTPDYFGPLPEPDEPPFTLAALQVKLLRDDGNKRVVLFGDSPGAVTPRIFRNKFLRTITGGNDFRLGIGSFSQQSMNSIVAHAEILWRCNFKGKVLNAENDSAKYKEDGAGTTIKTSGRRFQLIFEGTGGRDARDAGFEIFPPRFNRSVTRRE